MQTCQRTPFSGHYYRSDRAHVARHCGFYGPGPNAFLCGVANMLILKERFEVFAGFPCVARLRCNGP